MQSSDALRRVGVPKILDGFVSIFASIMWGLNMVLFPVEWFAQLIVEAGVGYSRIMLILDLAIAISALIYVYATEVIDIPTSGAFAVTEMTARSVLFLSSLALLLLEISVAVSFLTERSNTDTDLSFLAGVLFSDEYNTYLATFKHGIHSMMVVSIAMIASLHDDRTNRWVGSTDDNDESTLTFLIIVFIALVVSKFFSEVRHGEDARDMIMEKETIGDAVDLKSAYRFKHSRGAALTVSTGLLVYMIANADMPDGFWSFLSSKLVALTLSIYILVVSLERIAGRREWVIGGAGGLVITGVVSFLNLIAAALALAEDKNQEAVVVALGSILLDAMRVGYGQPVPERAVVSDVRKVFLRLLQALAGIISFALITKTETDANVASSPLLFGVALSSALVKIVGISYVGKDLFKTSTEHHFRELASTGLLLSSAYLWAHPLDDSASSAGAITFFVIGILCRFLDSILDFLMNGKEGLSYIAWDAADADGVDSPTSDNPRTWLTLLSLVVSLVFAAMSMDDKFDDIKLVDGKPQNKLLSDSMIVAVFFIALHVAVVLIGLLSELMPGLSILALSRSKFIRFAVTTTVLCSLAVGAGAVGFEGEGVLSTDSVQSSILSAIVAYLFADVVGRELL